MSSAGRCIARSTSSGMVVGPGIARNSRPARTAIVVIPYSVGSREGMQGNDGNFKAGLRHSGAMRSIEPGISRFPDAQLRIWGLVLTHHPGMTAHLPLFSYGIGDLLPDLVLQFGGGRAGNDVGGPCPLLARLDQPQYPHLAVGEIQI